MNELAKKAAALNALTYVTNNSVLGIGSGSTVAIFIDLLNRRVENEGLTLSAAPTSNFSKDALHKSIRIIEMDLSTPIDLTVDGADRVSSDFDLIKGGGGALLREKFVALSSKVNLTIIDEAKISSPLGGFSLPVEIVPFGSAATIKRLKTAGFHGSVRMLGDNPFITDGYNYIYDIDLKGPIINPKGMHLLLKSISGVIETGLFLQTSDRIIIGKNDLSVDVWIKGKHHVR
jgi:ribose 5-phosphate isomerase A